MQQLSGVDVMFLNMETSTTFGHVASLTLFDATGEAGRDVLEKMKRTYISRMAHLGPLRRRLVEVPLGLDLPYWVDDPDFDIDFHIRHHAVPPPGTPQQVSEVISRVHARPLDRTRPLWELYIIEGVDEGRLYAQFTKVHHATIDGVAGALMLAALLDLEPEPEPDTTTFEPWIGSGERIPTDQELLLRTAFEYLRRPEKTIRQTVKLLRELATTTQSGGVRVLADLLAQPLPGPLGELMRHRLRGSNHEVDHPPSLPPTRTPRTPWNASIGPHRRFAYTTLPLDDVRAIRRAVGCTFNDVVMALCSGTLRRYLQKHDALPDESLTAMVPISVRTGDETDAYRNRVSALFADLATNEADPAARLARVQASMASAKSTFGAIPAETLQDFTQFAPPAIAARALRMVSRLKIADRTAPPFNIVVSNVPGPNLPLYAAGARLEHIYPVSIVADGQGLNITVQSYNGNLDFGFIADRDLVPDVWLMTDLLAESLAELLTLT